MTEHRTVRHDEDPVCGMRVDVAQVGVSRLGTMFRIFFLPL